MKLNIIGSINSTGYGVVNGNIFQVAHKDKSLDFCFIEVGSGTIPIQNPDANLAIWHHFDLSVFDGLTGPKYLYTFFERDKLPKHEINGLNAVVDGIIVACDYSLKALRDSGYTGKLFKIHPGVDGSIFYDYGVSRDKNSPVKFFTIGKWELRKGYDILLECFLEAFNRTDNFELHITAENPIRCPGFDGKQISEEWAKYYKNSEIGDNVFIYNRLKTQHDVANLINQCDIGVFLSRSEGWNLEIGESIACGKQVIASGATSHTEFRDFGTTLIPYTGQSIAFEPPFFIGNSSWPEPTNENKKKIVDQLRSCLYNYVRLNSKSSYFRETHTWERTLDLIKKVVFEK